MDIKSYANQTVSTTARKAGRLVGYVVGSTEQWLLDLPRPLKKAKDAELANLAGRCACGILLTAYQAKSGKTLHQGLVNRQLNRYGKVANAFGLAALIPIGVMTTHELVVRHLEEQDARRYTDLENDRDRILDALYEKLKPR